MCKKLRISYVWSGIIAIGLSLGVVAQDKPSYDFFCPDNDYKPFGYFIGAGISSGFASSDVSFEAMNVSTTTAYEVSLDPQFALGKSFEAGAQVFNRHSIFRIVEVGVGLRNVRGTETVRAERLPNSDLSFPDDILAVGEFNYLRIGIRANTQFVHLMGPNSYFHHGPGLSIDWTLRKKTEYDIPHLELNNIAPQQGTFPAIDYTVGIGFKVGQGKFLDFYAHTPLTLIDGAHKGSREEIYNSYYQNIVAGVRFAWLRATPDRLCPAFDRPTNGRFSRKKSPSTYRPW